jgi:hypothetical protein
MSGVDTSAATSTGGAAMNVVERPFQLANALTDPFRRLLAEFKRTFRLLLVRKVSIKIVSGRLLLVRLRRHERTS